MNFSEVLEDIHELIGLKLQSITGKSLVITEVDEESGRLTLRLENGQKRTRPIEELKRIWDELQKSPAVHVDSFLNGSGTSRNQPETILANLPYIEWLKVNGKKHIAYVGELTHPFGTLQKMDGIKAAQVSQKVERQKSTKHRSFALVTNDITGGIAKVKEICPGKLLTIQQGFYEYETVSEVIFILSAQTFDLEEGIYGVMETVFRMYYPKKIILDNQPYFVVNKEELKLLIKEK